jgi:hypothetical protein
MTSAVKAAAQDAGNNKLLEECDTIKVTRGIWDYSDPGRLIAREIGAERTSTTAMAYPKVVTCHGRLALILRQNAPLKRQA